MAASAFVRLNPNLPQPIQSGRFHGGGHRTGNSAQQNFLNGNGRFPIGSDRRETRCRCGFASPRAELKRQNSDFGFVLDDVPHFSEWLPNLTTYPNPLQDNPAYYDVQQFFVHPDDVVAKDIVVRLNSPRGIHFRRAGPSEKIYFQPSEVRACIVTCGGLCPGLNTVIRELVCGLWNIYGVQDILGIKGGYKGFYSSNTIPLNPKVVDDIHKRGGTVLGTSRGGHVTSKIVDSIQDRGINQVYILGGDGTQRGASVIFEEIRKRGLKVSIAGIPKTVDNDVAVIDKSFGFDTAVEEAQRAIHAAHVEAESAENGVGLVKLMGRYSGFIAMYATLANRDVDCCLIPESPFYLEGKGGLYEYVRKRIRENGHALIVIAEGAGQELVVESMQNMDKADASGNRLLLDVGLWLSDKLKNYFLKEHKEALNLKYIDPTYMVRAIPSNAADNVYCSLLAQNATHGAMAGYTGFTVGSVNGRHAYIPITHVTETRKVKTDDRMWARLLSSTNQPSFVRYREIMDDKMQKESTKMLEEIDMDNPKTSSYAVEGNNIPKKPAESVLKGNSVGHNHKSHASPESEEKMKGEGAK